MIIFYVISVLLSLVAGLLVWRDVRTVYLLDLVLWILVSLVPFLNIAVVIEVVLLFLPDINLRFKYPFKKDKKTS